MSEQSEDPFMSPLLQLEIRVIRPKGAPADRRKLSMRQVIDPGPDYRRQVEYTLDRMVREVRSTLEREGEFDA